MEYVSYLEPKKNETTELFANKREQWVVFFLVSIGVIALTYGLLYVVDFLPEPVSASGHNTGQLSEFNEGAYGNLGTGNDEEEENASKDSEIAQYPVRLIIDSLDKSVPILNPDSSDIATLDANLLKGAVRHPDSGDFRRKGTIFILGHSSYLPNVINKNFQAFNGIQKLNWGDTIKLQSEDLEYVYRVDRVYRTVASEAEITIEAGKEKLILATCNSFGSKDDRFIVEATLVETHDIM